MTEPSLEPASFRDPSGLVFRRDGVLHRQIQASAQADWAAFTGSGLAASLVALVRSEGLREIRREPEVQSA